VVGYGVCWIVGVVVLVGDLLVFGGEFWVFMVLVMLGLVCVRFGCAVVCLCIWCVGYFLGLIGGGGRGVFGVRGFMCCTVWL